MEKSGDTEKRFHSIMDKLFHSPPQSSPSSSSGVQLSRGKKRPSATSILALGDTRNEEIQVSGPLGGSTQAPLCRPWDRGDLMRRLSTFKSMTWFARPKVVSAINCARRGWVNIDMDILACEQCGARLLFSTPSSWSHEQVEKAALVFSLKLDNGHKLLCPWINNACDENLAQFPPSTPQVLVDQFRERSSLLVQLLALPVISSSATHSLKSSQLDQFLEQTSLLELGGNVSPAAVSLAKFVGNGEDSDCAHLYHQALKLITLCGWEPRVLPYLVETSRNKSSSSVEDLTISNSAHALAVELCDSFSQPDPESIVLDCNLCGARVGLWAFSTVPRPVEFFRFVGFTEIQNEEDSGAHGSLNQSHGDQRIGFSSIMSNGMASSRHVSSSLNLSIAGGPPPREQNFKAKISLPVIGRSIRSRISLDTYIRNSLYSNQSSNQSQLGGTDLSQEIEKGTGQVLPSLSDNAPPSRNNDISENRDTSNTDPKSNALSSPNRSSNITENMEVPGSAGSDADIRDLSGHSIGSRLPVVDASKEVQIASDTGTACSQAPSGDAGEQAVVQIVAKKNGEICPGVPNTSSGRSSLHSSCETGDKREVSSRNELVTAVAVPFTSPGNISKKLKYDKGMHFDPFRQHRHFCPWIASIAGGLPGWQQTLSALVRQKEVSCSPPTHPPSSASLIKIDDPVNSVRRLFTSKRLKHPNRST